MITGSPPIYLEMQKISMSTILRIERPKPAWEGRMENGTKGFYKVWTEKIPSCISKVALDRCQVLFNWIPGDSMTIRKPDPQNRVGKMGVKTAEHPDKCWRINVAIKEWDEAIGIAHILICPENNILEESTKKLRPEVGAEASILYQISAALDSLLEDVTLLINGSSVVVSSGLVRELLASPIIRRKSIAELIEK